jgi:hypothetical protein
MSPDRPRSITMPPPPPTGPAGFEARLWAVEHGHGSLERALGDLTDEVSKLRDVMTTVQNTLLVATTEKTASDRRRETVMKWVVGVAIGVSVMALGTLAAWVIHLQSAMAAVGK